MALACIPHKTLSMSHSRSEDERRSASAAPATAVAPPVLPAPPANFVQAPASDRLASPCFLLPSSRTGWMLSQLQWGTSPAATSPPCHAAPQAVRGAGAASLAAGGAARARPGRRRRLYQVCCLLVCSSLVRCGQADLPGSWPLSGTAYAAPPPPRPARPTPLASRWRRPPRATSSASLASWRGASPG